MFFLKQIFTWWNRQTIGTMILTFFSGKLKGVDQFGNKYYESNSGKRWIVYKDVVEASKIPPNWFSWIHFTNNGVPKNYQKKYPWEKDHVQNLSGTDKAYRPKKIIDRKNFKKKYETWKI